MNTTDRQSDTAAFGSFQPGGRSAQPHLNKFVLQKIPSRLYLSEDQVWSPDIASAMLFASGWEALEAATRLKLINFQLVPRGFA
jgi:hypothetical protein